ncbi:MAG: hypothetical protein IJD22_00950 [Clostridia bacterium]|nr:hypothetical protein [Clostridia bacterium]
MTVRLETVYTRERLLGLNSYAMKQKWPLWLFYAFLNLMIILSATIVAVFGEMDSTFITYLIMTVFFDFFIVFMYFIYPGISSAHKRAVGMRIEAEFTEECAVFHAKNDLVDEVTRYSYTGFLKLGKKGNDIYLYVEPHRAIIVDISKAEGRELVWLKEKLSSSIAEKKFKWI